MLSERDLLLASATILTGILLIFTLFSFSVEPKIILQDKEFLLEAIESHKNLIENKTDKENDRTDYSELLWDFELDIAELHTEIKELKTMEYKKFVYLKDIFSQITMIIYFLAITVIFSLVSSLVKDMEKIKRFSKTFLPVAHVSMIITWVFIFLLATTLTTLAK